MRSEKERDEVWLRANPRPVAAFGLIAGLLMAVAAILVMFLPLGREGTVAVGVILAGLAGSVAAMAWAASRPRLGLEGEHVVVRLNPLTVERVPLEVVECVFRGTEPVAEANGGQPRFRVGTLILRLAERATDWRTRRTFRPWGSWDDGHIVIDGRWCEPLSPESARGIATKLAAAKRQEALECPP